MSEKKSLLTVWHFLLLSSKWKRIDIENIIVLNWTRTTRTRFVSKQWARWKAFKNGRLCPNASEKRRCKLNANIVHQIHVLFHLNQINQYSSLILIYLIYWKYLAQGIIISIPYITKMVSIKKWNNLEGWYPLLGFTFYQNLVRESVFLHWFVSNFR